MGSRSFEICVLGGTGFLGTRVVSQLAAADHRLRVPTRNVARHRHIQVLPEARLIQCDVHDPDTLLDLVTGCDVAINLVGILNEKGRAGAGFRQAHTALTEKLVEACQRAEVTKLVQVSALQADAEQGPSHYLRSKGEAERIIIDRAGPLQWTILQPSVIFGPGDAFINRFAKLLRGIPLVFPLARPTARFAPVYVDDVALAVVSAVVDPATNGRSYELYGPDVYSLHELVTMIAGAIGVRRFIWELPDVLARLQAIFMEFLPGKPFSMDNYRSLTVDSVGTVNGLEKLGITSRSMKLSLSTSLGAPQSVNRLNIYRQQAGR